GGVEDFDLCLALLSAGADNDVVSAIAVDVAGSDENAAGEGRAVSEEAGNATGPKNAAAVEDLDVGPTCGAGPGDNFVVERHAQAANQVDVAGRHADAARKVGGISHEAAQQGTVRNLAGQLDLVKLGCVDDL